MRGRLLRPVLIGFGALLGAVCLGVLAVFLALSASLPKLDGDAVTSGLSAPVELARDASGTVVVKAQNWLDASRVLGFVHAQERFFEMDLTRRSAAGELSALFGADTLSLDQEKRLHRLRARMAENWRRLPEADRRVITAYTAGVNDGLTALSLRPWQYLLVGSQAEPWQEVDTLLVVAEMYYVLQSRNISDTLAEALLRERIGDKLFNWMKPRGGTWDAALDGSVLPAVALPSADELNTRAAPRAAMTAPLAKSILSETGLQLAIFNNASHDPEFKPGSNNWAVAAQLSKHGVPILADDMHLPLSVPNIWFRAQLEIEKGPDGGAWQLSGVSLPGAPGLVVGSNGKVAWGFTSAEGDWFDWLTLPISADGKNYLHDAESVAFDTVEESIAVRGQADVKLQVKQTRWGPVMEAKNGRAYVLNWLAHWPGTIDARLEDMMWTSDVDAAIKVAQTSGVPQQNILIVDHGGNMAWTIAGRMPARKLGRERGPRKGFTRPEEVPEKFLAPADYPLIKNPPDGRLWTANNRQLGGTEGEKIGEGRGDLGARGQQIRDRLRERQSFDEAALYAIQRDTEARLLKRWVKLVGDIALATPSSPGFADAARLSANWNGRADADQAAYTIARTLRVTLQEKLKEAWVAAAAPGLNHQVRRDGRMEYAVWAAVTEKPIHLLPQPHASWDAYLQHELSLIVVQLQKQYGSLDGATWGRVNAANIVHPISLALPTLGRWLNMEPTPLGGDNHLPMVATRNDGASQRLVVSPGRESSGILVMPGGQSGHPLSPFYGAGHAAWLAGEPSPLLAGPVVHRLRLTTVAVANR